MAIRRRANELLAVTALILACSNILVYFSNDEVTEDENHSSKPIFYDYIHPPTCETPVEESIRLNELIANSWYKCKRTKRIPDESFGFHICVDEIVGIQHVFSGDRMTFVAVSSSNDEYRLEKTLLKIAGTEGSGLIINDRPTFPASLRRYAQQIRFFSISLEEKTPLQSLATDLADRITAFAHENGGERIDILRLGCIDCWTPDHLPRLLEQLRPVLTLVRQLHLVIKFNRMDPSLFYLWYRLLVSLFFTEGGYFVLYAAQQLGECGRKVDQCQYQLAFARVDAGAEVRSLSPAAGMGSPDEEYNRLIWYLESEANNSICSGGRRKIPVGGSSLEPWTICDTFDQQENGCLIYHFSLGQFQDILDGYSHSNFSSHCTINVFDPTVPYDQHSGINGINVHSVTLADEKSGKTQPGHEMGSVWRLSTLEKLLEETNPQKHVISLMILDLQGGEWDVFEQLLAAASVMAYSQVSIRIRVWQGEENENYRQYYSWFHRLQKLGFQRFHSRSIIQKSDALNRVSLLPECSSPRRCYEIGWVSTAI